MRGSPTLTETMLAVMSHQCPALASRRAPGPGNCGRARARRRGVFGERRRPGRRQHANEPTGVDRERAHVDRAARRLGRVGRGHALRLHLRPEQPGVDGRQRRRTLAAALPAVPRLTRRLRQRRRRGTSARRSTSSRAPARSSRNGISTAQTERQHDPAPRAVRQLGHPGGPERRVRRRQARPRPRHARRRRPAVRPDRRGVHRERLRALLRPRHAGVHGEEPGQHDPERLLRLPRRR